MYYSKVNDISIYIFLFQIFVALKLLNQLIPPVAYDEKDIHLVLGKEKIIIDEPKLSLQFAAEILPALVQVCFFATTICAAVCISTK